MYNITNSENFTCGKWDLTDEEEEFQSWFGWWVQGLSSSIIDSIGIILNIFIIIVSVRSRLKPSIFYNLLTCLAFFDSLYLIASLYESFRFHLVKTGYCTLQGHLVVFFYPFRKMVLTASTYTTLAATWERYSAIVKPLKHRENVVGSSRLKTFTNYQLPVIILTMLYNLPLFFSLEFYSYTMSEEIPLNSSEIEDSKLLHMKNGTSELVMQNYSTHNYTKYCIRATDFRLSRGYMLWYNIVANGLITGIIPMLLMLLLNGKIYITVNRVLSERYCCKMGRSSRLTNDSTGTSKKDIRQVIVLFGVTFAFCICHILRIVLNVEELITFEQLETKLEEATRNQTYCDFVRFWTMIANDLSHLLLQLNSSINFLIYYYWSSNFRRAFKTQFLKLALYLHLCKHEYASEYGVGLSRKNAFIRRGSMETLQKTDLVNQNLHEPLISNDKLNVQIIPMIVISHAEELNMSQK